MACGEVFLGCFVIWFFLVAVCCGLCFFVAFCCIRYWVWWLFGLFALLFCFLFVVVGAFAMHYFFSGFVYWIGFCFLVCLLGCFECAGCHNLMLSCMGCGSFLTAEQKPVSCFACAKVTRRGCCLYNLFIQKVDTKTAKNR